MASRIDPYLAASRLVQLLIELAHKLEAAGLEKSLIELVKVRASQVNGFAVCLIMHSREQGESDERLLMLDAWHESGLFTPRERAALAWTEALTQLASTRAPDELYAQVKAHFSDEESIALSMLINVINRFNRLGVGYRVQPIGERAA